MKTATLNRRLQRLENKLIARQAEYKVIEEQKITAEKSIESGRERKTHHEMVAALLVKTADEARDAGRKRMEKVVTKALQYVFGSDFTFEIELDESGGKPIARFLVCSKGEDGNIVKNEPQDSRGGGINDIVASALQVATMVVYNQPKIQGPIVLDEPGKHVSEEYVVRFGNFLEFISKTFNRQITMVTHQPHLAVTADRVLVSQLVGGKTVIKEKIDDDDEDDQSN